LEKNFTEGKSHEHVRFCLTVSPNMIEEIRQNSSRSESIDGADYSGKSVLSNRNKKPSDEFVWVSGWKVDRWEGERFNVFFFNSIVGG
jgi:hypothetical protein